MSELLESIAPSYVRERRLHLALAPDTVPAANQSLVLSVDYNKALPEGVVLPLVLEVQGPSPASYQRREFVRTRPLSIVLTPREGGAHLVTLREVAHNRWWGSLHFDVEGTHILRPER